MWNKSIPIHSWSWQFDLSLIAVTETWSVFRGVFFSWKSEWKKFAWTKIMSNWIGFENIRFFSAKQSFTTAILPMCHQIEWSTATVCTLIKVYVWTYMKVVQRVIYLNWHKKKLDEILLVRWYKKWWKKNQGAFKTGIFVSKFHWLSTIFSPQPQFDEKGA